MYRIEWNKLTDPEKTLIREATSKNASFLLKLKSGGASPWYSSVLNFTDSFSKFLGWYVAEGSISKTKVKITQSKQKNLENYNEIIETLDEMGLPHKDYPDGISVGSSFFAKIIEKMCSKYAENKKIPLNYFDIEKARLFLDAYFKGDGNIYGAKGYTKRKRYSTTSEQLKNDLVTLIGALGGYASISNPTQVD